MQRDPQASGRESRREPSLPIRYSYLMRFPGHDQLFDLTIQVDDSSSPPIPGWSVLDAGRGLRVSFRLEA